MKKTLVVKIEVKAVQEDWADPVILHQLKQVQKHVKAGDTWGGMHSVPGQPLQYKVEYEVTKEDIQ